MLKEVIKPPFIWGAILGATLLLIVIFWTGWVVTASVAESKGEFMAKEAVLNSMVPICVDQYTNDPMNEERLLELQNISIYQRDDIVDKYGWSIMPGAEKSLRGLADKCASKIIELNG